MELDVTKDPNATPAKPDPNNPDPTKFVQIPVDEWASAKARLDALEKVGFRSAPAAPAAPTVPAGPTLADQISTIEKQIEKLDESIDAAVHDGKPVSKMMKERSALDRKITRLQIKSEDIDPAFASGIQTIEQISAEVTRNKMPHYDIVKDEFESALRSMPADQRMNPQIRQAAYNMAVGQNIDKITEAQKEKILRESVENPTGAPPAGNGRNSSTGDQIPKAEDFLKPDTLAAIQLVGKTPDEYFKKFGYKGGYNEWYQKHYGKKEEK